MPTERKQRTAAPSRKAVEASPFHEAVDMTFFDIVSIGAPFVNYPFPSVIFHQQRVVGAIINNQVDL
ncbi:hypothetical protein T11_11892 [Trichinella zimbabwensis]|uniref:Uncharacterized protein n=1 Tax=Trichinella zimbabwensis TaxID=268475 RepID=A0A0V1GW77_9BILA|nr:hypothetical protein T11_11892 [Trichinella zimbabwensis]